MTSDATISSQSLNTESQMGEALVLQSGEHDDIQKESASYPCMNERKQTDGRHEKELTSPNEELTELLQHSPAKCGMPHSTPTLYDYACFIPMALSVLSRTVLIGRMFQREATPSDLEPSVGDDDRFQSPSESLLIESSSDSPLARSISFAEFGAQFGVQYVGSISQESLTNGHSVRTPSPAASLAISMIPGRQATPLSFYAQDTFGEDEDYPYGCAVSRPPSRRERELCGSFIMGSQVHSQQSV